MSKQITMKDIPSVVELQQERVRERYKIRYNRAIRSTITTLVTVAAIAVIISYVMMPVLRIYGHSMTPTLTDGQIVLAMKNANFEIGDIIAFYYNNKILIKRVIAAPGDWVDIDEEGTVTVNDNILVEPYISEKAFGETNVEFPMQIPENRWFVLGDHRSVSIDSRNTAVGCVSDEQVVGKLVVCIWPFKKIGFISG